MSEGSEHNDKQRRWRWMLLLALLVSGVWLYQAKLGPVTSIKQLFAALEGKHWRVSRKDALALLQDRGLQAKGVAYQLAHRLTNGTLATKRWAQMAASQMTQKWQLRALSNVLQRREPQIQRGALQALSAIVRNHGYTWLQSADTRIENLLGFVFTACSKDKTIPDCQHTQREMAQLLQPTYNAILYRQNNHAIWWESNHWKNVHKLQSAALQQAILSSRTGIRRRATIGLLYGGQQTISFFQKLLTSPASNASKREALNCVVALGHKAAPLVPQLQQLLAQSTLRTPVIRALSAIGPKAKVAHKKLCDLLSQKPRCSAVVARSLGRMGVVANGCTAKLKTCIKQAKNTHARAALLLSFARINQRKQETTPLLRNALLQAPLQRKDNELHLAAIKALQRPGHLDTSLVRPLMLHLKHRTNSPYSWGPTHTRKQHEVLKALVHTGSNASIALPMLLQLLRDNSPSKTIWNKWGSSTYPILLQCFSPTRPEDTFSPADTAAYRLWKKRWTLYVPSTIRKLPPDVIRWAKETKPAFDVIAALRDGGSRHKWLKRLIYKYCPQDRGILYRMAEGWGTKGADKLAAILQSHMRQFTTHTPATARFRTAVLSGIQYSKRHSNNTLQALRRLLISKPQPQLYAKALVIYGRIENDLSNVRHIWQRALFHHEKTIRNAAAELANHRAKLHQKALELVVSALTTQDKTKWHKALQVLEVTKHNHISLFAPLRQIARQNSAPALRQWALTHIARISLPPKSRRQHQRLQLAVALANVRAKKPQLRQGAIATLASLAQGWFDDKGHTITLPRTTRNKINKALQPLLRDPQRDLRIAAFSALRRLGLPKTQDKENIKAALQQQYPPLLLQAIRAYLAYQDDTKELIAPLSSLFQNGNTDQKQEAIVLMHRLMRKHNPPDALFHTFAKGSRHSDVTIQRLSIEGMAMYSPSDPRSIPYLLKALQSKRAPLQSAALRGLKKRSKQHKQHKRIIPALFAQLAVERRKAPKSTAHSRRWGRRIGLRNSLRLSRLLKQHWPREDIIDVLSSFGYTNDVVGQMLNRKLLQAQAPSEIDDYLRILAGLGKRGKTVLPALLQQLGRNGIMRTSLLHALRKLQPLPPIACLPLMHAFAKGTTAQQKRSRRLLLGLQRIPASSLPHLVRWLNSQRDNKRYLAVRMLGATTHDVSKAVPQLQRMAQRDPSQPVRAAAARALQHIQRGTHK